MQKVMIKGLARDDRTLRQLGVASGAKVMVVGSTLNDVLSVAKPDTKVGHHTSRPRLCVCLSVCLHHIYLYDIKFYSGAQCLCITVASQVSYARFPIISLVSTVYRWLPWFSPVKEPNRVI